VHFSFLCPLSSFLADLLPSQTRLPYPSVRLSLCLSLLHPRTHLLPPHRSFFSVNHLHLHLLSLPLPFPGSFKYHPSPGTAAGGLGSTGKVKLKGFSWFVEVDQVRSSRLCLVVFAADHQPCMLLIDGVGEGGVSEERLKKCRQQERGCGSDRRAKSAFSSVLPPLPCLQDVGPS
jgi:hypothetical protein